jgi:hypothetical protein
MNKDGRKKQEKGWGRNKGEDRWEEGRVGRREDGRRERTPLALLREDPTPVS